MLDAQEKLAVIDQATDEKRVVNVDKIRTILWHNWCLSEAQVDVEIRAMLEEGMIDVN